ncbi:MAG: hypothetical protein P1V35_00535 [Planctomycetota bacterium]|nr:hypothetical protein [Planctomycetota bacterium]
MKNQNATLFLTLLAGILLGSGVGYMLFGGNQVQAEFSSGLSNGAMPETATPSASTPKQNTLVASVPDAVRAKPKKAAVAQVTDVETERLMASVDVEEVDRMAGEGVIFGHVADMDGNPVAGVVVRLTGRAERNRTSSVSKVGKGAPERPSLKETVRKAAQGYHESRARNQETTTDANGDYRFEELLDQSWSASAYLKGHLVEVDGGSNRMRVGSELDFIAKPVIQVPVQVLLPDGMQPERAVIDLNRKGKVRQRRSYDWTPDEPFLRVVPGRYEVRAYSHDERGNDLAELASKETKLQVKLDETPEGLTLELAPRLGISGFLKAEKGFHNRSSCTVRMLALTADQEVDLKALKNSDTTEWAQVGTRFSFPDLEPGRYVIGVGRDWSSPIVAHEVIELVDQMAEMDLTIPAVDRSHSIRVLALDVDGVPVDDVRFNISESGAGRSNSRGLDSMRDGDSGYLLTLPDRYTENYFGKNKSDLTYALSATHEDFGTSKVDLTRGQTEVSITFQVPGTLAVTIPGYLGSGREGRVTVSAKKKSDEEEHYFYGHEKGNVDVDGVSRLEGLEPGLYVVTMVVNPAKQDDHSWTPGRTVNSAEFEVRGGENSMRLVMPTLYDLRVHWADAEEGTTIQLQSRESANNPFGFGQMTFDSSLTVTWTDLPAGDYTLQSYGGESSAMEITVPCGELEFVPMLINAMRVSITDSEGDLAKVGLRDGDLIIGADGKEFQDQSELMAVGQVIQSKTAEVDFIVLRGNTRVTVRIAGADIGGWQSMGGQMQPASR